MSDAKSDLKEANLDVDFDENEENPKMLPVDICRFRPFCSLLACS
jgi:hypothetical protein